MTTINIYTYDRKTALKVPETVNLIIQAKQSETGEKDDKGNKIKAFHPNLTASVYFSAPVIGQNEIVENIAGLMPFIKGMLCEAQKGIVKAQILDKGAKSVDSDAITVAQCIKFMADTESGKITDDYIKQWFTDNYADHVRALVIAGAKWGDMELTDVMVAQVETKVNAFRDILALFANAKFKPESRHYTPILKFVKSLGDYEDSLLDVIKGKCEKAELEMASLDNLF